MRLIILDIYKRGCIYKNHDTFHITTPTKVHGHVSLLYMYIIWEPSQRKGIPYSPPGNVLVSYVWWTQGIEQIPSTPV
jgi:hypothetical protein